MSERLNSEATSSADTLEIHHAIKKTTDFSDKLSPMLVKELRQGLKGVSFMVLFIAIQLVLGVLIIGYSFSSSYNNTGREISSTIFICIGLATCVIQPLRGISAIGSEIKENTIDLMVITSLSAWRIVFGKWISLVSQSALIIASVTPYLILRYFFGGMQLFAELMVLLTIFIASAGFTALFVGISSIPSLILRGLIGLSSGFFISKGIMTIFMNSFGYRAITELCSFQTPELITTYSLLLLSTFYIGWLALDYGAASIAPISENRATPRRLICLGIISLLAAALWLGPTDMLMVAPILLLIISIPISIISLTEPLLSTPTVSIPFVRRGALGRIGSYLFYPGWASGLNFILLLFYLTLLSSAFYTPRYSTDDFQTYMVSISSICFSCLVFPLLLTRVFFKHTHKLFIVYLGCLIATGVLWLLITIIAEENGARGIYNAFFWFPPVQFKLLTGSATENLGHVTAIPMFLIYYGACTVTARRAWIHVRNNDAQAKGIIATEKNLTE